MRLHHKTHLPRTPRPVVLDEAYQREVDTATARLEHRYREAQRRAEHAQNRLALAQKRHRQHSELARLEREVTMRHAELFELERLMTQTPAGGATHRGTDSYRKVPR